MQIITENNDLHEDTGLVCHLLHETALEPLLAKPLAGHLFENLVISDLRKSFFNRGEVPHFYFYRTTNGDEVDLIIERRGGIMPLEIKFSKSLNPSLFQPLERFCKLYKTHGKWISLSQERLKASPSVETLPFGSYLSLMD